MLCHDGCNPGSTTPIQSPSTVCIPQDHYPGKPQFRQLNLGTLYMAFHRQAANWGSLDWGVVDTALYNEAFTVRAKTIMRCSFCLSDNHISVECPYAPVEVKTPEAMLSLEEKMGRPPIQQSTQGPADPLVATVKICRLFNDPAGNQ